MEEHQEMRLKKVWGDSVTTDGQCEIIVLWVDRRTHRPHRYCRTHHLAAAICENCGQPFHTKRPLGARTCSDRCRKALSRKKRGE